MKIGFTKTSEDNVNHDIKSINPGNIVPVFLCIKPFTKRVITDNAPQLSWKKKIKPRETIPVEWTITRNSKDLLKGIISAQRYNLENIFVPELNNVRIS